MTDEQFDRLMKKLEEMEQAIKAGTWWPQRTYPLQPAPVYYPQNPGYLPPHWNQPTD